MSISPIGATGFQTLTPTRVDAGMSLNKPEATDTSFSSLVTDGIDRLSAIQAKSDGLAVQAATGDLTAIHQYTIAATEAQVSTQLTVAMRNKAVDAFNEIMRMPV